MTYPIEARCQCGQVHYRLLAAPLKVMACHCQACQTLSSAPYSVTALVRAEDIAIEGELAHCQRVADSGNLNLGFFCPGCGVRIYQFNPQQPEIIKLKLKPVGPAAALFAPQAHVWISEKLPWVSLPDGMPCFERQAQ